MKNKIKELFRKRDNIKVDSQTYQNEMIELKRRQMKIISLRKEVRELKEEIEMLKKDLQK